MRRAVCSLLVAIPLLAAAPARAQDAGDEDLADRAYWTIGFYGGILAPLGDTADSRESGLVATARLGWTSRLGLGGFGEVGYSPLPRTAPDESTTIETHLLTALVAPRFTLGKETFRAWVAAGGGGVLERTTTRIEEESSARTALAAAATAAVGLEMHFFSNGGLTLAATGLQSFGDPELRLYGLTGGLVFLFH